MVRRSPSAARNRNGSAAARAEGHRCLRPPNRARASRRQPARWRRRCTAQACSAAVSPGQPSRSHRPADHRPPAWVGPAKPTCRWPWWPESVNQGRAAEGPRRADLARLDPGPATADPQRQLPGGRVRRADRAAVDPVDIDPAPHLWLDTRRVPLTYQEWPLRRHETRMRWRAARPPTAARTRRSSRGEAQSPARPAPGPVGEAQPRGHPCRRRGGWGLGLGQADGRKPADTGELAANHSGVGGGKRRQQRHEDQDGDPA